MSLDVYLYAPLPCPQCGHVLEGGEVYSANITHNLNTMAGEAGIYECLWRPEEVGITKAGQIIEPLRAGITKLRNERGRMETFNAINGWGTWKHFVPWCEQYLQACIDHPEAFVRVSR